MTFDPSHLQVIAQQREAVLATIRKSGRPQLSNVLYTWDAERNVASVSTTADRAKARNLMRDPRAALYVPGAHFWTYIVADADAKIIGPTTVPGDPAGQELLRVHSTFYSNLDEDGFFQEMVDNRRLVIHLSVTHTYGLVMKTPPGD